jgi:hypothetical protein
VKRHARQDDRGLWPASALLLGVDPDTMLHAGHMQIACLATTAAALRLPLAGLSLPSAASTVGAQQRTRTLLAQDQYGYGFEPAAGHLLPGWREVVSDRGEAFYFNDATGESRWEAPLAHQAQYGEFGASHLLPGWREVVSDNGETFFFNDATGASQWEAPLAQQAQYGDQYGEPQAQFQQPHQRDQHYRGAQHQPSLDFRQRMERAERALAAEDELLGELKRKRRGFAS